MPNTSLYSKDDLLKRPQNFLNGVSNPQKAILLGGGILVIFMLVLLSTRSAPDPPVVDQYECVLNHDNIPPFQCGSFKSFRGQSPLSTGSCKEVQLRYDTNFKKRQALSDLICSSDKKAKSWGKVGHPWSVFEPFYNCEHMDRVGPLDDGGKWSCHPRNMRNQCVVYSMGLNINTRWDEELAKLNPGCQFYGYDPGKGLAERYMSKMPAGQAKGFPLGVSDSKKIIPGVGPVDSIYNILKSNGEREIDIFKIDIEWSEWTAVTAFFNDPRNKEFRIAEILIEMHAHAKQPIRTVRGIIDFFIMLEANGFYLYQREMNPYNPHIGHEFAFVHKDFVDLK